LQALLIWDKIAFKAAGVSIISKGGVDYDGVVTISPGVVDNWFKAQASLNFTESFESFWRKRSEFPN
jgi:hypothetical protein